MRQIAVEVKTGNQQMFQNKNEICKKSMKMEKSSRKSGVQSIRNAIPDSGAEYGVDSDLRARNFLIELTYCRIIFEFRYSIDSLWS